MERSLSKAKQIGSTDRPDEVTAVYLGYPSRCLTARSKRNCGGAFERLFPHPNNQGSTRKHKNGHYRNRSTSAPRTLTHIMPTRTAAPSQSLRAALNTSQCAIFAETGMPDALPSGRNPIRTSTVFGRLQWRDWHDGGKLLILSVPLHSTGTAPTAASALLESTLLAQGQNCSLC